MNNAYLESLIAITSLFIFWVLYRAVFKHKVETHPGSKLVLSGFGFLLLSFVIDITDNFPELSQYIFIGVTPYQIFIEKVVGSLLGLILLAIGFQKWLPAIMEMTIAKNNLAKLNQNLEQLVAERTAELSSVNNRLLKEITAREKTQLKLNRQMFSDSLTQLPNRYALLEYLDHEKNRHPQNELYQAIFLIDIDNFKSVNDSLGHSFGDQVLVSLAKRLAFNHRAEDFLGRVGGDEFVLVLPDIKGEMQSIALQTYANATKMLEILKEPLKVEDHYLNLTASIGITVFCYRSMGLAEDILRQADIALYHAKDKGQGLCSFFEPEMQKKAQMRLSKANDLRNAIKNNELFLCYQPQVDNDGKIIGLEALLRWQHPSKGELIPTEFISLAEEISIIDDLGRYSLRLVCQQTANIISAAHPERQLKVAINISPSHFLQPDFVAQVDAILSGYDLSGIQLVLEITEEETIADIEDITSKMTTLRSHNVHFSLDDFGTGYSSLTYLKRLPIDTVKIDRSFISDFDKNPDDASIVTAILMMTNSLKIDVIAEGIENSQQHKFLKQNNCQYYQGYYFGKPQRIDALIESGLINRITPNN